ncbi:uncharacterized protein [Pyxicephalus adspersus]|uniref:uncharacterized protein isoform X2 n=1 Tax=Pyxicephalus adspersus TaxID=30357 RepID=UPI003B5CA028
MFLGFEWKPEYPEETHADTGRTCKLHADSVLAEMQNWDLALQSSRSFTSMECIDHLLVGIFSRGDRSTYEWLIRDVISIKGVKDVRPVLITNDFTHFKNEVHKCSIGILYHSQKRGRLNITDVTDSLYDEELRYMCQVYGQENVMVVIGDMEDTSDEKKASLLSGQPSIGYFARDLFLFNEIKGDRAPFQASKKKVLENCIKEIARKKLRKKPCFIYSFIIFVILVILLIVILVVYLHPNNHTKPGQPTPPTNITSAWQLTPPTNITSAWQPTPPTNITSAFQGG